VQRVPSRDLHHEMQVLERQLLARLPLRASLRAHDGGDAGGDEEASPRDVVRATAMVAVYSPTIPVHSGCRPVRLKYAAATYAAAR
jgi:hypothetical protein